MYASCRLSSRVGNPSSSSLSSYVVEVRPETCLTARFCTFSTCKTWPLYPHDCLPVCRSRVEEFLEELGRAAVGLGVEEGGRVRVLVTSHGGFIREMNLFLVRRFACSMPCQVCTDLLWNVCYGSRTTWKGQPQKNSQDCTICSTAFG